LALLFLAPDVILANTSQVVQALVIAMPGSIPAALAAKAATTTIPIVFGVGGDPVKMGLVASLAQPGGNATGINFFLADIMAKRLGLLHDLVPKAVRIAVLVNPTNTSTAEATLRDIPEAAGTLGLQIQVLNASTATYPDRSMATVGGLMSYGTDFADMARQVGVYTGKILKGAKPADLPVLQSTKFEFVINLQTASALGLEVPNALQLLADEVIE
jgi:putative tryptophan/tyrosine transport system substrate-binding protein